VALEWEGTGLPHSLPKGWNSSIGVKLLATPVAKVTHLTGAGPTNERRKRVRVLYARREKKKTVPWTAGVQCTLAKCDWMEAKYGLHLGGEGESRRLEDHGSSEKGDTSQILTWGEL